MRAGKTTLAAMSLAFTFAAVVHPSAHRLDEFLQTARIDLRDDRVVIDLALSPGADLADATVATIDADRNGVMTPDEQAAYAEAVLSGLAATLDGARLSLRLTDASFPTVDELRGGDGTIRLQLGTSHSALSNGRHRLFFSNGHHPGQSVYLANALVPASSRVSVIGQRRTFDQRELTIDYSVATAQARFAPGLLAGLAAAVVVVRYTRRHENRP